MNQPKYYTPTVDDLVWGLEYEFLNFADQWVKKTINSMEELNRYFSAVIIGEPRIKHLDEDDIIELGWRNLGPHVYCVEDYFINTNNGLIKISSFGNEVIYFGQCRNKAELKRLMSNLSIING